MKKYYTIQHPQRGRIKFNLYPFQEKVLMHMHNEDYIYEEELLDYCKNDTLSRLEVAFSRDGPAKKYVQHLMIESKERLWDLISNKGAHVYVCGGTNMGKQVRDAFEDIISDLGDMTGDEATKYVKNMQDVRPQRYTQELWS